MMPKFWDRLRKISLLEFNYIFTEKERSFLKSSISRLMFGIILARD